MSLIPVINLSPVLTTPVKIIAGDNDTGAQLLPMTRTMTPSRWGDAKDRRKLKGTNGRYLWPLKWDTAADGVIGIAMKSGSIDTPHIVIRGP
jgi:hypothetical protein